jgi:hypothetical protein
MVRLHPFGCDGCNSPRPLAVTDLFAGQEGEVSFSPVRLTETVEYVIDKLDLIFVMSVNPE